MEKNKTKQEVTQRRSFVISHRIYWGLRMVLGNVKFTNFHKAGCLPLTHVQSSGKTNRCPFIERWIMSTKVLSRGLFTQELQAFVLLWCSSQDFGGLCCLSNWQI